MESSEGESRVQTVCLVALTILAGAIALHELRSVLVPFILALFFAFALKPLIDVQIQRFHWPRSVAIVSSLMISLLLLLLLGSLLSISIIQIVNNMPEYLDQVHGLVQWSIDKMPEQVFGFDLRESLASMTIPVDPAVVPGAEGEAIAGSGATASLPDSVIGPLRTMLLGTAGVVTSILSQGMLVTIFVIFLLIGGGAISGATSGTWAEVESQVRKYILTKFFVSALTGILVGLTLLFLGIKLWLVIAFFAFVLNFIPNVGSLIATLLPIPIVVLSPDLSMTTRVLAISIPSTIQFTIGNFIEPKMLGESLDLHPVTVLLSLMLWGVLWGIVGMLLAVPMTSIMKILFARIPVTAPIAEIMAGRFDRLEDA